MARRGLRDNKGLTTRERCTRPSCSTSSSPPLSRKVLVLHTRDTVRLRKLSVPHDLRRREYCATRIVSNYRPRRNCNFIRLERVAKHCIAMAQMSSQTRASKEPQSTLKSSPRDAHQVVGAVINLGGGARAASITRAALGGKRMKKTKRMEREEE